jgi:hypothetical protein
MQRLLFIVVTVACMLSRGVAVAQPTLPTMPEPEPAPDPAPVATTEPTPEPTMEAPTAGPSCTPVYNTQRDDIDAMQLLRLADSRLNPRTVDLIEGALALRQLADPNFRNDITELSNNLNQAGQLLNVGALYRGSIVRGNVNAAALLDHKAVASASLEAAAAWELPICTIAGARGSITFDSVDGGNHARGYVEGSACLPLPVTSFELRLGYRHGVRPTLLNRGIQSTDELNGLEFGLNLRMFRMLREAWDLDFYSMSMNIAVNDYTDPMLPTATSMLVGVDALAIHRYGRGFGGTTQTHQIFHGAISAQLPDSRSSTVASNIDLYRVEGVSLTKRVGMSLGFGVVQASVDLPKRGVHASAPGGFLSVMVGDPASFTEARFAYFAQAGDRENVDMQMRGTLRAVRTTEKIYIDGQTWVARSQMLTADGLSRGYLVYGGTLDLLIPLWRGFNGYLRGEGARVVVPDAAGLATAIAGRVTAGITFSARREFVNHRRPTTDPQ